jgi:hypothetical protein
MGEWVNYSHRFSLTHSAIHSFIIAPNLSPNRLVFKLPRPNPSWHCRHRTG